MGRITDLPDGPVMPAYQSSGALSNASGSTSHERPALGDRKISQTTAMSRELQGILARENSHVESSEPVSPHQTKLREWMGAQQLALSHSVTHQVNKSVGQAAHVLERLTRGAAALQAEQAGQLKRVGDWLHAQSGEAAQSWLRTVGRLNQLASRSDQTSVTLTFLVLRALNDEEPSCEDAIAYLENMLARDPDAVIQMMPQLADSLMYFEERHGGLIPPHALSRPTRVRSESEEELAAIGAALLAEAPAAALDGLPVAEGHVELAVAARGAGGQAAYPHALEAWILNECNRSRHFKLRWLWCLQATGGVAAERLLASVQSLSLYQCGLPEQNFIDALLELSRRLVAVPREHRQAMLQRALGAVNEQLADTLWLPIAPIPERHHRVVRMLPNESIVLSTKARVPYLLICETLPVDETWDAAPGRMTDYGRQLSDTGAEDNDYALQGEEGQGVSEVEVVPYNASYAYEISATGGAYGLSLYDGLDFSAGASAGGGGVAAAASLSASLGGPLSPLRWSVGRHAATVGSTTGPGSFVNLTNLIQTQLPLAWCARQPRTASTLSKKVHVDDIVQPSKHPSRVASPKAPARLNGAGGSGSASRALSATPELLASAAGGQVEGEDVSLAQQTVPPLPIAASGKEGAVTATERLANRLRIFGETWAERERRVAASSQYGNLRGWSLLPVIVKANDDLRQEQFAVQLINVVQKCYDDAGLPLQLRTALIVATTPDGGLVQVVTGAISLDSVKKTAWGRHTLRCVPIGLRRAGVEGAPACVDPLHRVLRGVGGGVLFAADQGQAQRKHPSASGGLYRSHRLRLPDLKFAWRQHWLRECALQAHSRVRRADGWRGQWQFPPLPQSLRAGLPRSAPARRQDNAAG
mmetsp:Transcript_4714/g.11372  ORF Transcript_4714/g.11372 Transcript_4714/m.11372 type:complete len:874 (-) Transcript_4714:466-3087(-)